MPLIRNTRIVASLLLIFAMILPSVAEAATFSVGTETSINGGTLAEMPGGAKLDATHAILAYTDSGAGKAEIATISGTTITLGAEYQFCSTNCYSTNVVMLDSTHALIAYETGGTGYAVIATISGTSISYGTATQFDTSLRTFSQIIAVAALDSTHVVIEYVTGSSSPFSNKVIAATISGSTITFGSATTLTSNSGQYVAIAAMDSTHFILFYSSNTATPSLRAGSVSGTSISLGSAVTFSGYNSDPTISMLDSTSAAVVYRSSSGNNVYAFVTTLSGTSLSNGSAQAVTSVTSYYPYAAPLDSTRLALIYKDVSASLMKVKLLRVSSGTVSGDTAVTLSSEDLGNLGRIVIPLSTASALTIIYEKADVVTLDVTSPSPPTSLTATPSGSTVSLGWTNPADSDFSSVTIRRSTSSYPTSVTDGSAVASGLTGTSAPDSGLADGTYYYSLFALDTSDNASTAATVSATVDTTAPAMPGAFAATVTGNSIAFTWTNPTDSDFSSVILRRSTDNYPASASAGTAVTTTTGTSYTDSGLADGTYYYSLFARDTNNNDSVAAHILDTVSTPAPGGSSHNSGKTSGTSASQTTSRPESAKPKEAAPAAASPSPASQESAKTADSPATQLLMNVRTRLEKHVEELSAKNPKLAPTLKAKLARLNARIAKRMKR